MNCVTAAIILLSLSFSYSLLLRHCPTGMPSAWIPHTLLSSVVGSLSSDGSTHTEPSRVELGRRLESTFRNSTTNIRQGDFEPSSILDCLTRYVFPDFLTDRNPGSVSNSHAPAPMSTDSTDLSRSRTVAQQMVNADRSPRRIRVVHDPEIRPSLLGGLTEAISDDNVADNLQPGFEIIQDWQESGKEWGKVVSHGEIHNEEDMSGAARGVFAEAVNRLMNACGAYKTRLSPWQRRIQWTTPPEERRSGVTDWILYIHNLVKAVFEWKRLKVLPDRDIDQLHTMADLGDGVDKGFDFWIEPRGERTRIRSNRPALSKNSLKACLQVGYSCSFNGRRN